jgi:hypothetical protein
MEAGRSRFADNAIKYLPYLLLLIAFGGIAFCVYMRQVYLAIMGLALIVPVLIAAVTLLARRNQIFDLSAITFNIRISFTNQVLIFVLLFIISLVFLLANAERPIAYLVMIAFMSGALVLQIITSQTNKTDYVILTEMVLLSLNIVWGLSLKYPFFFGSTDIMVHLNYIQSVIDTGHISGIGIDYRYFPAYHVFNAIGSQITGLESKYATFIVTGIAWQAVTLFSFLIFKRFGASSKLALLACLIFIVDETEIYFGSYSIARSLAFILFMGWLYLAINFSQRDNRFIPLLLILTGALILTHHTTLITLAPVLIIFYVCQKLFLRTDKQQSFLPLLPVLLLEISFFSYLLWAASSMFNPIFRYSFLELINTETSMEINPRMVAGFPMSFIFNSMFFAFVLVFSLIGIHGAWNSGSSKIRSIFRGVSLAALLFLVFYLPYPLGFIPQTRLTYVERFPLLVLPFIAFAMAFGIYYLMSMEFNLTSKLKRLKGLPVLTLALVGVTTFFSLVAPGNAQDNPALPNSIDSGSTYFTSAELHSFLFINQNGDDSLVLYGDYFTVRDHYDLAKFRNTSVLMGGNIGYIEAGYVVLRSEEMAKRGGLTFSDTGSISQINRYHIDSTNPDTNILSNLKRQDTIYNNGSVQTYLVHNNSNSSTQ